MVCPRLLTLTGRGVPARGFLGLWAVWGWGVPRAPLEPGPLASPEPRDQSCRPSLGWLVGRLSFKTRSRRAILDPFWTFRGFQAGGTLFLRAEKPPKQNTHTHTHTHTHIYICIYILSRHCPFPEFMQISLVVRSA